MVAKGCSWRNADHYLLVTAFHMTGHTFFHKSLTSKLTQKTGLVLHICTTLPLAAQLSPCFSPRGVRAEFLMKAQFLSCRKSPEPHNLVTPAKTSPGRPVLLTAVLQAGERTHSTGAARGSCPWAEATQRQAGRPSACTGTTNGPGGKRAAACDEWRQSSWNGPKSCKSSTAAARGCPQHIAIPQGWAGWWQHSSLHGPDVLEGPGHILRSVEVPLHPVIAPKVGLLPRGNPKRTSPAYGGSKVRWWVCYHWEINKWFEQFFGSAENSWGSLVLMTNSSLTTNTIDRCVLLGALPVLAPHQHLTRSHFAALAWQAPADVTCILELVIPLFICITLDLSRWLNKSHLYIFVVVFTVQLLCPLLGHCFSCEE